MTTAAPAPQPEPASHTPVPLAPGDLGAVDLEHLTRAIDLARAARERGDHPFGALLVTSTGRTVEAMNTVGTGPDPIGHAETNLVREAGRMLSHDELASATLYTSTEPCAMCSGAIYWADIPRVVFALSEEGLRDIVDAQEGVPTLALPSREVFARGGRPVEVVGPVALTAASEVHEGFWQ